VEYIAWEGDQGQITIAQDAAEKAAGSRELGQEVGEVGEQEEGEGVEVAGLGEAGAVRGGRDQLQRGAGHQARDGVWLSAEPRPERLHKER